MPLELESLKKAIDALRRAVRAADENIAGLNADLQDTVKAGVVHNFKVTYELCWKFIQRWIRNNLSPEDADFPRSRKELFRIAARSGLVSDPIPWFEFGEARNLTSHTCDAEQAAAAYEAARRFLPHAEELLARLEQRND